MAKYIKKKHLKNAVEQLPWYHVNRQGELVEGAHGHEDALVRYRDVKAIVKGLPTKKIDEQVTGKLADGVISTDIERGVWDYKGDGKWEQTEPSTEVETMSCAECKHKPIGAEICEEPCHYEPSINCSTCGYSPQTPSCDTCEGYSNWWALDPCDECVFVKGSRWCDNCDSTPKGIDALPNSRKAEQTERSE